MMTYLTALREKRAKLQAEIDREYTRPQPDGLILTRLKRLKLRLRERIERLERHDTGRGKRLLPAE